ncbi:uncharacterized protein G2W53_012446 [Senna tora]|uniref:Uncharacterized protein n=1 Tax=Senna tora TaxID=362788 RepID=A0A834TWS9_9FABA|nr:uncharacterized protein G2W53_012446 [Senna tora]
MANGTGYIAIYLDSRFSKPGWAGAHWA